MNRGGGGLTGGLIELTVALALFLLVLYWAYWAWVHYWPWIVGGAIVIAAILVFVRWLQHRGGGW